MTDLHLMIPIIEYNETDCKDTESLINDILKETEAELRKRVKPNTLKATFAIIYNAFYKDGSYDITGSGRPRREQGKDSSQRVPYTCRSDKGNKEIKAGN